MHEPGATVSTRTSRRCKGLSLLLIVAVAIVLNGCARMNSQGEMSDPLQPINRPVSVFNGKIYNHVLSPAANYYEDVTPKPVRTGVTHFFSNLGYPDTFINDFLQAKLVQGVEDTGRFITNSTLGLGGLFDVASHLGMKQHEEDFGQTLGVWGSGPGPYLVLPLLGPSDFRDAPGQAVSVVTNLLFYVPWLYVTAPLTVLNAINTYANEQGAIRFRNQAAISPYIFTRQAFLQHRRFLIYDGNPPLPSSSASDNASVKSSDQSTVPPQ